MTEFIVLTLLYLDNNMNNIFDQWDKIIELNRPGIERNVYCKIPNTKDAKPCWYSSEENSILGLGDDMLNSIKWKHYNYNSEIFEKWYIPGRFLYAEFIDWKYLYVSDESKLNKNNTIYSLSNDDSMYINDLINKIFYWIITLLVLLWIWLIFAPKKNK